WELRAAAPPRAAGQGGVVGHRWWWESQYPALGVVTANELHVPARVATYLTLESADVAHSFWIPRLAGKTDVIPNRRNEMWLAPWEPGTYLGQWAEDCGTPHAHMLLRGIAHSPEEFQGWVVSQRPPPATGRRVGSGRQIFEATACVSCHTVHGTDASGTFGPDLTHLMSRETLGAGVAPNGTATLKAWVADPNKLKPGVLMPAMQLSEPELDK